MLHLVVNADNFSVIRESLKQGNSVEVNEIVTLVSFEANTERVNAESGKVTRTPFYYIDESGKRYTSTTLKTALGIEAESKGKRETTTFAKLWGQCQGLAKTASSQELREASKYLADLAKEISKQEKEKKDAEIAELERRLAELKQK